MRNCAGLNEREYKRMEEEKHPLRGTRNYSNSGFYNVVKYCLETRKDVHYKNATAEQSHEKA